jgi:DNA ligase 1
MSSDDIIREKLEKCLIWLALKSGFDSFENFRLYKESTMCSTTYKAVYPSIQILSEKDDKVYVDNLKVMTAQNLYDSKTGETVKLNDKLSKELEIFTPPINWWASEKWDGIRALWDGEKMISRGSSSGKPKVYTYIPQWFKSTLPPGIALDGEIWIGRNFFQKTSRLSTLKPGKTYTQKQIDDIWSGKTDPPVIFKVFDIPTEDTKILFEQRMRLLQTIVKDRKKCWDKLVYDNKTTFPIQFTEQVKIKSMEQLIDLYTKLTSAGAEGIMLRASGSPYETKRSKYMLKYKKIEDSECIVREHILGKEGKYEGMLASIRCEILKDRKPSGIFTQIGTGFNDSQRENYIIEDSPEYLPLGSVVSFSYLEMTNDGIPRHPVYKGIRDDIAKPKLNITPREIKQIFTKLTNKLAIEKEQNWQFKIKSYKQALSIIPDDAPLRTVEDYIGVLRSGGMLLKDEEEFKVKYGSWNSSILQKIDTILKTGEIAGISSDSELIAVENLIKIPGIGPSNASKLYKENNIKTIEDLKNIYKINNKIINSKQAIGLIHYDDLQERIPREEMDAWRDILSDIFLETLKELNINGTIELAGSYRRGKPDSGDIDILITTDFYNPLLMQTYYNNLIKYKIITRTNTISNGPVKIMVVGKIDDLFRHIDIFYYEKEIYPFALLFTTGSKEFNVSLRAHAIKNGYSLNERNLTHISSGRTVLPEEYLIKIEKPLPETEEDIFNFLDYKYIEPKKR